MLKKLMVCFIGCYFLMGSLILPLSDFSLIQDLPKMYQAYEKLATPDDRGIADFIGDYLLSGRMLLGHNKHDRPENSRSGVQFQHTAGFCSILQVHFQETSIAVADVEITHPNVTIPVNISDFHEEMFRPPLNLIS